MKAIIDFDCIEKECQSMLKFDLLEALGKNKQQIICQKCHRIYEFDKNFIGKLNKLRLLILAVRDAEDILGDCHISVITVSGEVRLPYQLLLTRLNTIISLECYDNKIDFNFRVEPLNNIAF